ncbi:MAG TPA: 3-isopropylmalate dehydratase small subunit [Woeseiaceae bacterium]|jgi:3-isopropylmalate/(R)-2-methylmalate dehydratase small subunit|nr:3-isopropylmalate dehydratase small subunit [Woeseiaceae bacterium]
MNVMQPITRIASKTVVLPTKDVDTDQIVPARFLTTTSRDGLGEAVFADLRLRDDGSEDPDFPLNRPEAAGCTILVAGNNFGCGSSREHAPWALLDYGLEAVISTEIADIFRSNSLKNGLLAIVVDEDTHEALMNEPGADIVIDVESLSITMPDGSDVSFTLDSFARYCLLEGTDQLGFLRSRIDQIEAYEEMRAWKP